MFNFQISASILQSRAWEELQKKLGREVRRDFGSGALIVTMPLSLGFSYDYVPHGGGAELSQKPPSSRAIFLRVEPRVPDAPKAREELTRAGFYRVLDVQPSETLIVDLTKSEEELLREMEHDTRYAIRAALRRGVTVECAEGEARPAAFAEFWELFEATNARHELHAYEKRYYEALAAMRDDASTEIFLARLNPEGDFDRRAEQEGESPSTERQVLAAAIVAYFGDTAYYLYAASRAGYGKWNAPSFLLWEIIRRAKTRKFDMLDLWGVSSVKKEWAGVTAFKKSFGGTPVSFIGTWDFAYQPFWYAAYRAARGILRR